MKVTTLETLAWDAGWRNYHYVKLPTDNGIIGWSEFDEGFGAPGESAVIQRLAPRVVGQMVGEHKRIYAELYIAWDHELVTHVPDIVDGYLILPDRPGWGVEPNEEAIRAHPAKGQTGLLNYGREK